MNFMTAVRSAQGEARYYREHCVEHSYNPDYIEGEVLEVYVGTWKSGIGTRPQVILANSHPPPGPMQETFTLAFRGPRQMAIELFEGYVGMLP